MLFRLSSEISEEAVRRKNGRASKETFAKKFSDPGNYASIITSFPEVLYRNYGERCLDYAKKHHIWVQIIVDWETS